MDITQEATCKLCGRVVPVKDQPRSVFKVKVKVMELPDAAVTEHFTSETNFMLITVAYITVLIYSIIYLVARTYSETNEKNLKMFKPFSKRS